jgi:hypothetical protein
VVSPESRSIYSRDVFTLSWKNANRFFKVFAYSGVFILIGLSMLIVTTFTILTSKKYKEEEISDQSMDRKLREVLR